jgi:lysozyme family protein
MHSSGGHTYVAGSLLQVSYWDMSKADVLAALVDYILWK